MHELGSVKECPKCGSVAEYHARPEWEGAVQEGTTFSPCPHSFYYVWNPYYCPLGEKCLVCGGQGTIPHPASPERLKRICVCGYMWYEKTKDARKGGVDES